MTSPTPQALDAAEQQVADEVAAILTEVADEFTRSLADATEIVAARFSVSGIARMWTQRVPRLVQRLLSVAETAAGHAANDLDVPLPDGWDDLPGRHQDGRDLPDSIGQYVTTTEHLLRAVGDRLAEAATTELAAGLNAGDSIDQLRDRLQAVFTRDGAQLGPGREDRIARTEAARAWNTATLAAAQDLTGPDRPLVKQWVTRHDSDARHAHRDVDGQLRLLDETFTVADVAMTGPGDPTAPPELVVNCRCVLRLAHADRAAAYETKDLQRVHVFRNEETGMEPSPSVTAAGAPTRAWSTPGDTAIAFENQETGDGRIFAAGSLSWDGPGPWPLQYADEMLSGHEGAELAGAIQTLGRDGDRITATGVLYPGRPAGADALMLLEENAPLGVSVDLDDVDVQFVDRTTSPDDEDDGLVLAASLASLSLLRLDDGAWMLTAHTTGEWTASGIALSRTGHAIQLITGPNGSITTDAVHAAFASTSVQLTAAAGDPDDPDGTVVHSESSGDLLLRITRARLRGATLVAMPAYDRARIVLDDMPDQGEQQDTQADVAAAGSDTHHAVVAHVSASPVPIGAREVAKALGLSMETARGHLTRAAAAGRIVRLSRGQYVGTSTLPEGIEASAALTASFAHLDDQVRADGARLTASLWHELQSLPPMPAEWFKEPTPEELPKDAGGVFVEGGRIWGWVAQSGVEHAGYPGKRLTIESLGSLDLSHFLRARFHLDDGSTVRAGAFTMNVGHHRDGAECETAACQFDDSRTVAGIVTVGQNENGMWFAGAANPKLSTWDQVVFQACQPSYHMRMGPNGRYEVRGLLDVPMPGHSSPLLATAVAERANLALAASAAGLLTGPDATAEATAPEAAPPEQAPGAPEATASDPSTTDAVSALTAALTDPAFLDGLAAALERREHERAAEIAQLNALVAEAREEITASAAAGLIQKGTR